MGVETSSIAANLERILERIARAAQRAGRRPEEVTLVAVSKTFPAESIRQAYGAGVRHFGENRVQEWEVKQPLVTDLNATWHLVGHLQSNKAARAARLFHRIDSLDSLPLAQKLDRAAAELTARTIPSVGTGHALPSVLTVERGVGVAGQYSGSAVSPDPAGLRHASGSFGTSAVPLSPLRLTVLIEVRLAPEETKTGVAESELPALAEAVLALPHLDLRGLMCIPPYCDDPEQVRPYFRKVRELRDTVRGQLASWHASASVALGPAEGCHSEPATAGLQPAAPSSRSERRPAPEESLLPELSMGMSHDFEVAIEEGATQVRLGTALFGPRQAA